MCEARLYTYEGEIYPLSYAFDTIKVDGANFLSDINFEKGLNSFFKGSLVKLSFKNNTDADIDIVSLEPIFYEKIKYIPENSVDFIAYYFNSRNSDFDKRNLDDLIYYSINDVNMERIFLSLDSGHADEGEYISFLQRNFRDNFNSKNP